MTEPERQFALVRMHIAGVRSIPELTFSKVLVIVERNLGFEAEHMERALRNEREVHFYKDMQASRTGVLTTENVKLGAMTLTNIMLREQRVHILPEGQFVSQVLISPRFFLERTHLICTYVCRMLLQPGVVYANNWRFIHFNSRPLIMSFKKGVLHSAERWADLRTTW